MPLKSFEDITHELTEFEESVLLPMIIGKFVIHKGKENAIKNSEIRQYVFDRTNKVVAEPRIRKIAEHIRQTHLLDGLVAGRQGYFIAVDADELKEWIETMKQRRNAINSTIASGERSLKRMTGFKQPNQHKSRKVDFKQKQVSIFQQ